MAFVEERTCFSKELFCYDMIIQVERFFELILLMYLVNHFDFQISKETTVRNIQQVGEMEQGWSLHDHDVQSIRKRQPQQ